MKLILSKRHINEQAKKFGFDKVDEGVYDLINDYHLSFVRHVVSKRDFKKKFQKGGRVALPLEYFNAPTTSSFVDSPTFTNITPNNVDIRPSILLNDPSGGLATPKAMAPFIGGAAVCFKLTKNACKDAVQQLDVKNDEIDKRKFLSETQQKFESLITKAVSKVKLQSENSTLKTSDLRSVLNLQKFKTFRG